MRTNDELPVVHCRDCAYLHDRGKGAIVCDYMNYKGVTPDGFCAWGRKKEETHGI